MSATKSVTNPSDISKLMEKLNELNIKLSINANNNNNINDVIEKEFKSLDSSISSINESLSKIENTLTKELNSAITILNSKVDKIELELTQYTELNKKTEENIKSLERYLGTIVKAVSKLYQSSNELQSLEKQTSSKLDNLTQLIISLAQEQETPNNESNNSLPNSSQTSQIIAKEVINENHNQVNVTPKTTINQISKGSLLAKIRNIFAFTARFKPN